MNVTSQSSNEELGPRCPKCGGPRWRVQRSTKNKNAWIRKRICKACGYFFVSIEHGPTPLDKEK